MRKIPTPGLVGTYCWVLLLSPLYGIDWLEYVLCFVLLSVLFFAVTRNK